jgi:precorrin-8X/cobalt-precorrin-8 methylmutase
MDELFDSYLMVDWSANNFPKRGRDSIWICLLDADACEAPPRQLVNAPTRRAARQLVEQLLLAEVSAGHRVLVGFDFPYGYPAGFAALLDHPDERPPWRIVWQYLAETVIDDQRNRNNRFEVAAAINQRLAGPPGPFWGCPVGQASAALTSNCPFTYPFPTAGAAPLEQYRRTDRALNARGTWVQPVWKLAYPGSVGSQALVGIPVVEAIRFHPSLAEVSTVWPFELTDPALDVRRPLIVHAEIWPGVVPLDNTLHSIRDAAQVWTLARAFSRLDHRGELGQLFRLPNPDPVVCDEEGWILGA